MRIAFAPKPPLKAERVYLGVVFGLSLRLHQIYDVYFNNI